MPFWQPILTILRRTTAKWAPLTVIFTDSLCPDITIVIRHFQLDPQVKSWRVALDLTQSTGDGGRGTVRMGWEM